MASTPYGDRSYAEARDAPRERSVGEHVFIWIAWALAAAFWGASLTTMVEIFRAAGQATPTISVPGASGGSAYLVFVVIAFLVMALALAYASIRSAMAPSETAGEAATAALYNSVERQRGDDRVSRSADLSRQDREFR